MTRFTKILLTMPLVILGLSCCKKTTSEPTKNYLDGEMLIADVPVYVNKGGSIKVRPYGVIHPLGKKLGYCFSLYYSSSKLIVRDTTKRITDDSSKDSCFSFVLPDTLATYTLSCYAFPEDSEDYYTTSTSVSLATVDSLESIPQIAFKTTDDLFEMDSRDNRPIFYVEIGDQIWMRKNLIYHKYGVPFLCSEAMRPIFGSYYTWEEATKACPAGWHLPSNAEWAQMAKTIDPKGDFKPMESFNGVAGNIMVKKAFFNLTEELWQFWPAVNITNSSDFSAIPAGYCQTKGTRDDFFGYTEYACFWTSDLDPNNADRALYRYIYEKEDQIKLGSAEKNSFGANVRCIKD